MPSKIVTHATHGNGGVFPGGGHTGGAFPGGGGTNSVFPGQHH
jgi:hypothetical protein